MKTVSIPVCDVEVQIIVEDDAIARMMSNGKEWEPETREVWRAMVFRGNGVVVDVGAYSGVYAIASALMGAKVMALEPHPANYARLVMNAALNSMRIDARPWAASDSNGTKILHATKSVEFMSDIATLSLGEETHWISVNTRRIDDLPLGGERVGLLKIDTEGHELDVLEGAKRTIATHKPVILVEVLTREAAVNVAKHLVGYRCIAMLDKRNALYE